MPVIIIQKDDLLNLIGKKLSDEEIEKILFMLKVETEFKDNDIECELNPDRPDMFSVEGIARAMKGFLGIETGIPKYKTMNGTIKVKSEDVELRQHFGLAVIRNVELTDELVKSLMQLQEKLNETIGRKRRKTDIGVFDLDKTRPPYVYTFMKPEDIRFVPLGFEEEMSADEVLEKHPKGIKYGHIIKEFDKYPVLVDANKKILGLIPVINADFDKVTPETKNLLIDVIGLDKRYVEYVLNILVSNIAERSGIIETVKVGRIKTPNLDPKQQVIEVGYVNEILGLDLKEKEIAEILERMRYTVVKLKGGKIDVLIPPFRTDVMHPIDIVEDVAIGYGYNNIEPIIPKVPTVGGLSEVQRMSRKVRELMVGLSFQEYVGMVITNPENNFGKMKIKEHESVEILNPASSEYNMCRTWLLPSLLKVLSANKHRDYPQKVFEVGDCILIEDGKTKDIKKLAGVVSYDNANLTEMKSIVESVMSNMDHKVEVRPLDHESFIESRCGQIIVNNKPVGFFGEIHPEVLISWTLEKPVIAFEIDLGGI